MLLQSLRAALLFCSLLLLTTSPPDAAARERPGEPDIREQLTAHVSPRLIVTMSVNRSGNEATYGVSLRNPGNAEVRDIFLAATIAGDTAFVAPGPNPARSGFGGVEGNAAVWLSEAVPAYSTAGPFTYRVRLAGETADPVTAWVHWLHPGDGTAISSPVRVLPGFTAGPLATLSVDALPPGPLMWRVLEITVSAQGGITSPGVPQPRLVYILGGVRHFAQDGASNSFGPSSGHVIRPGIPFVSGNRTDSTVHWLEFHPVSTAARGAPPPVPTVSHAYESEDLTGLREGPYDMLLLRAEAQPGANSALHEHPGPVMVHLLEGTVAHTDEGVTRTVNAGEFWVEQVGAVVTTRNTGTTKAVAIVAILVPKGEDLAIFHEAPNLFFR